MGEGRSDLQQAGIEALDEVDKRNIHLNQETSHTYSEGSVLITERWVWEMREKSLMQERYRKNPTLNSAGSVHTIHAEVAVSRLERHGSKE